MAITRACRLSRDNPAVHRRRTSRNKLATDASVSGPLSRRRTVSLSRPLAKTPSGATEGLGVHIDIVVALLGLPRNAGTKIAQAVRRLGTHGTGGDSPAMAILQLKKLVRLNG